MGPLRNQVGVLGTSDGIGSCSFASGTFQVLNFSRKVLERRPPLIGWCWWNPALPFRVPEGFEKGLEVLTLQHWWCLCGQAGQCGGTREEGRGGKGNKESALSKTTCPSTTQHM